MRIALGLDVFLKEFAERVSARDWREFVGDDPDDWQARVLEVVGDEGAEVFFNLDGVDVWKGLSRAAAGRGGPTDWELLQLRQNPQWWARITWIKGGLIVPNPF